MKQHLINIYEDTVKRFEKINTESITTKHTINDIVLEKGIKPNVSVINSDTVSAGVFYAQKGKTCIINMASYKRPGGGVKRGAHAQEECLFRCSNLIETIPESFYPLKLNEGIYTKYALFIKNSNYVIIKPVKLDVVTVAAINLNSKKEGFENTKEYKTLMKTKMKLMLSLASENDCDNLILGAWGCGVFHNNPKTVAKMFKEVIDNNYFNIKNIVFAIINDHNSVDDNYNIFKNTLN